jgi:hypothetical protein
LERLFRLIQLSGWDILSRRKTMSSVLFDVPEMFMKMKLSNQGVVIPAKYLRLVVFQEFE